MKTNISILLVLIGLFLNIKIFAQSELDTTFGGTGKMEINYFRGFLRDIAVQPDDKILLVSKCQTISFGNQNICLGRRNQDGSADTTFGTTNSGYTLTQIPNANTESTWEANGLAIQNDGKIVVVGNSRFGFTSLEKTIFVVRYNSNGTLDTAFGENGVAKANYYSNNIGSKVVVQPDGKIVLVGYSQQNRDTDYLQLIIRFNSNGTPDQTFSGDGIATVDIAGNYTVGASIALQEDGRIVTGGWMRTAPGNPTPAASSLLVRLNKDGSLDTTFDGDGVKTVPLATSAAYYNGFVSVAVQSDGQILGLSSNKKLYRFNTDGSPDNGFDSDGSADILASNSNPFDVIVTPSGKTTVTGEKTYCNCFPANLFYQVGKYLPNGAPDTSFSGDGYLEIDITSETTDFGVAAAFDSKGRVALGGISSRPLTTVNPYENPAWSLARLNASAPPQNVGFSGRVTKPDGRAVVNAYLTMKNGDTIIGYARTNPFGHFRFTNVPSNITYTLSTVSKNLSFYDRSVLVDGAVENYLVVGVK